MRAELAARRENILGEGPIWDPGLGRLYWVDIRARRIEWFEPASRNEGHYDLSVRPSALARRKAGGLLVAADRCIGTLDLETGAFASRVEFEADKPSNRTNDGAMGADGRFWFGTMDDNGKPGQGALYALSPDWRLSLLREGLTIPNGIVSTPDGERLYVADSHEQAIWVHRIEAETLSPPSLFFAAKHGKPSPDGAAIDEDGFLWSAQWDGACVVRLSPTGDVEQSIDLPVSRPTACAFGGADLSTLFITSARDGLSENELAEEPLAGSLFSAKTTTRGVGRPLFAG